MRERTEDEKRNEVITLKVAQRPPKHYRLLQFPKKYLNNYISLLSYLSLETYCNSGNYNIILYIIKGTNELRILTQNDWSLFISSKSLNDYLSNSISLKIEYQITSYTSIISSLSQMNQEEFLKEMLLVLQNDQRLSADICKSLVLKKRLLDKKSINIEPLEENEDYQKELIKKFTDIKLRLKSLEQIESSLLSTNYDEPDDKEILHNGKMSISPKQTDDTSPNFDSYYSNDKRENYRLQLIRETMSFCNN